MELSVRERLAELVEQLTTSGRPQLDQNQMKELKKICRGSDSCIDHMYHLLMTQLDQDHAEIRLSAFQVASELFTRSHHFRTLLVDNFQEFLELTVETDADQPLPPPKEVAKKLKSLAIQTVKSWQTSYGSAYKKLALGYHFLKQVKKVDFQDAEARTVAERRRDEERQSRMERIYKARLEAAAKEMEESYQEIESTLTEMESCMKLLFPDFGPQTAAEGPSDDEQPCCSKNLKASSEEGRVHERDESLDEKKSPGKEMKGDRKMSDTEEEEKCSEDERRADQKKRDGDQQEGEREVETVQGKGEHEEDEEEAGGSSEEDEEEAGGSSEEDEEEECADEHLFIRNSGLISHSYSLDLDISPGLQVTETEDNEPVVSMVIELHKLITTKHLPAVQSWVQVFTKSHAEEHVLRRALDLKKSLEAALQKHKELHIDYQSGRICRVTKAGSDGEEEDDDFDEVPEKEGFEPHIPEHLRAEYGLDPSPSTSKAQVAPPKAPPAKRPAAPPPPPHLIITPEEDEETDGGGAGSNLRRRHAAPPQGKDPCAYRTKVQLSSCSKVSSTCVSLSSSSAGPRPSRSGPEEKTEVPVVPFGLDLYYWGKEQPNAGKIIKSTSQHQFWVPAEVEEEVENQDLLAESKSRYISFPGRFVPVSHSCRAPLGNGKLCPRQDRLKCPFHGQIVPRDAEGRPCREEDRRREEREERKRREEQPEWRDAELMRDIEAATGEDLGSSRITGKKRKGKKKKYPNLSDLKQSSNTARSRLQKKVFNKKTVARIAQVMSKVDKRKHDKFSNQFNYAIN